MKIKGLVSLAAAVALFNTASLANDTTLGDVDVWETEIVSSSLNLGSSSIETKQADHLSDLLSSLPGVEIGGTHSINNRLNIRGLQDENIEITIDGAKVQNANMFHHIGNLLINPDILKKADIQVGTNSVVNGSLGGAVAFETKGGTELLQKGQDVGARVQGSFNSNKSTSASVAGYGKVSENADFLIYHNMVDRGNWENGKGIEMFGVDGEAQNTLLKFGYRVDDKQKLSFSYDRLVDEGDYLPRPDFSKEYNIFATGNATFPTEYVRDTITIKHEYRDDLVTVDTTIYSNKNELERTEVWVGRSPRPSLTGLLNGEVETEGVNVKAQSNLESGDIFNTFTYGVIYDKQTSKVTWDGTKYGEDESAKTTAIYVEDKISFDNGAVFTPGIRYNGYDFDGSYGEIDDSEFTYSLATEYPASETLTLLASTTTLYKGVEMVDVLASNRTNGSSVNSKGVKSETGVNTEVGFKYVENGVMGADSVGFLFKYFNTTINDYITNKWADDYSYNYMTNSGDLDIKGFEASFVYDKDKLHALTTYSSSKTEYSKTNEPDVKDPGDSVTLNIDYKLANNISLAWESIFMMKEDDVPSGGVYNEKDAYNVHDIAVNWKPSSVKGLTVVGGIDNIFDKAYLSHISENRSITRGGTTTSTADYEPGRSVKVSVAYKF